MNEDGQGGAFKDALENLNALKSTSKNILTGILSQNLGTYLLFPSLFFCPWAFTVLYF